MIKLFAPNVKDFYKAGHIHQYEEGTEYVYSNFTPRHGKHSNIKDNKKIVWVGLQIFIMTHLIDTWNETFFNVPKDKAIDKYKTRLSTSLGYDVDVSHMEDLHDLGYLPVRIKALPEGSLVPYGVPVLTIVNTLPEFYWVTNMLETSLSSGLWQISTSATTYNKYRLNFLKYAEETGGVKEFVPFQGHDFSYRGMGIYEGALSGLGALLSGSQGTDTIPAIDLAEEYYGAKSEDFIAGSVNATEHSVMCLGTAVNSEFDTFKKLITETYPEGIVSIVSDSFDFWQVITDFLPRLKDDVVNRKGKVVIRPDSGDPVKILTGYMQDEYYLDDLGEPIEKSTGEKLTFAEVKGLISCLWEIFGGTTTKGSDVKDYRLLDEHIGAIYGDSITLERQEEILKRLKQKGYSSSNVVLGIGSYTYQYVTRDTHGWVMKATWAQVNGKPLEIFKDPKTDSKKKSAKGLLHVTSYKDGQILELKDQVEPSWEKKGALETVFLDGKLVKTTTLEEIRKRVASYREM